MGICIATALRSERSDLMERASIELILVQLKLLIIGRANRPMGEPGIRVMFNSYGLTWPTRLLLWFLSKRPDIGSLQLRPQYEYLNSCWQQRNQRH